jgi:hypothetical protein
MHCSKAAWLLDYLVGAREEQRHCRGLTFLHQWIDTEYCSLDACTDVDHGRRIRIAGEPHLLAAEPSQPV